MPELLPPPRPEEVATEPHGRPPDEVGSPGSGERRGGNIGLWLLLALVVLLGLAKGWSAVFFVGALVLMIFLHELGHYVTAKWAGMKVTQFFIGFGPRIWSFRRGDTEYGVKALPLGAYVRIIGMNNLDPVDPGDEDRAYRSKPYWRRLSVAVAGSVMHFLLAALIAFALVAGYGRQQIDNWVVQQVLDNGPAAAAGIRAGDRILAIDGSNTRDYSKAVDYIRSHPGANVTMQVLRGGQVLSVSTRLASRNPDGQPVGFLGFVRAFPRERPGLARSISDSASYYGSTFQGTVGFLTHFFSPHGISSYISTVRNNPSPANVTKGTDRPTSVIGLVDVGSAVTKSGLAGMLDLLVLFNIAIGIFNLIPLPPLDGGHVAIATYERIRSRRGRAYHVDATKLMPLTYAVVLLLGLLFLTSAYLDITRGVGG